MMSNNTVYKVICMGNVNLKLHDGTIKELKEVRYVPDLKRNLISLGILDQTRFNIKLEYSEIKIIVQ